MEARQNRLWIYLCSCLLVVVMSWEHQQTVASSIVIEPDTPEESLRLRVLAHNDHPEEQWLKNQIRDEIIDEMHLWATQVHSLDEARTKMIDSQQELQQMAQNVVDEAGYDHEVELNFGMISFPAKLYGQHFYPAGDYEGLLIKIGAGQGENWWCVLFPPLCFIDTRSGQVIHEAEPFQDEFLETSQIDDEGSTDDSPRGADQASVQRINQQLSAEDYAEQIETKFFVVEVWERISSFFSSI